MALTRITKGVIKPNENYDTHNINSTGVITATAFNGDGSSLTGVANTDFVVGTAITMVSANFTGNVSIAGTLTYEDVTNIDSVGIITARNGIYLDKFIYHSGDLNTSFGFPNNATDTFVVNTNSTEKVRITSDGKVGFGTNNPAYPLEVVGDGGGAFAASTNSAHGQLSIVGKNSNGQVSAISRIKSYPDGSSSQAHMAFETRDSSSQMVERLRITSAGRILIATTTEGHSNADDLTIATAAGSLGNTGITIRSSTTGDGNIFFSDATSGDGETKGVIKYAHNTDHMQFNTAGTERLRITTDGRIGINQSSPNNYELDIRKRSGVTDANIRLYNNDTTATSDTIMRFQIAGTDANNYIYFGDSGDANAGQIRYNHGSNYMSFNTNGTEQMRISSTGAITKPNNPSAFVFEADGPGGTNAVTSSSQNNVPIHFDHSSFSKGGMTISNGNSRFAIPVTGVYFVSGTISGDCDTLSAGDGWEFHILKNGVQVQNNYEPIFSVGSSVGQEYSVTVTRLMDLDAGDYIELALANIDTAQGTVNRGSFSAFLVG
tara:strand:- start:217 stop:1860 length:1644 start_codon:yes stop_codon:yes gene_type:complete